MKNNIKKIAVSALILIPFCYNCDASSSGRFTRPQPVRQSVQNLEKIETMFGVDKYGRGLANAPAWNFDNIRRQFLDPPFLASITGFDETTASRDVSNYMSHMGVLQTNSRGARFIPFRNKSARDICDLIAKAQGPHYVINVPDNKCQSLRWNGDSFDVPHGMWLDKPTSRRELFIAMAGIFLMGDRLSPTEKDIVIERLVEVVLRFVCM